MPIADAIDESPNESLDTVQTLETPLLYSKVDKLLAAEVDHLREILQADTGEQLHELVDRITEQVLGEQLDLVKEIFPEGDHQLGVAEVVRGRISFYQANEMEQFHELETLAQVQLEKEKTMAHVESPENKGLFNTAYEAAKAYVKMNIKTIGITVATVAVIAGLLALGWWVGAIPKALTWLMSHEAIAGAMGYLEGAMEGLTGVGLEQAAEKTGELVVEGVQAAEGLKESMEAAGGTADVLEGMMEGADALSGGAEAVQGVTEGVDLATELGDAAEAAQRLGELGAGN